MDFKLIKDNVVMLQIQKLRGFTLLELMIVIAIIAILAAIAYPSYQDSVRKARRGDAQADLVELANFLERRFTESNVYNGSNAAATLTASGITSNYYTYTIPTFNAAVFTIQAAPTGDQANDSCGTMTLSNTNASTPANCW